MARGRRKGSNAKAHPEHLEWLKLVEVSGPFLSLPVLASAFPQGLEADDRELRAEVKAAHAEWCAHSGDVAIHRQWIRFVLARVLGLGPEVLVEGSVLPRSVEVTLAQHHETLRPDFALLEPGDAAPRKVRLVLQALPPDTSLDRPLEGRRWKASPATRMAELVQGSTAEDLSLGLVTNGEHWMLVSVPKGGTAAFVSWYATLWAEEPITLRALRTFLGAGRFFGEPEKRLEALIAASASAQHEVTDQLGLQVREAIELLVQSIDRADRAREGKLLEGVDERTVYEAAVTVMMRLVFVFYAEEQGLLPLAESTFYREHYALSPLGAQLEQVTDRGILANRRSAWCRLLATFRAIHGGVWHEDLRLPAYGGGLFDPDRFPLLEGRSGKQSWREEVASPLPIDDATALFVLEALQKLRVSGPGGTAETRQLSFRALDIEQIGHVYESLLDHTAKRAGGAVLGLEGKRGKEPEVELEKLEGLYTPPDHKALVSFVHEATERGESAIQNDLADYTIEADDTRWLVACGNDFELLARVRPFAGLVREDRREEPVIIRPSSLYVTSGTDRRSTGTHYTPKSLTEPIVRHTLEPLVYLGPAEGKPQEEWQLKSPREILELKVCDMTCGSGAFLVQACRYLSERLVEAWSDLEKENPSKMLVSPTGEMSEGKDTERALPKDASERLAIARRAVLDRCLYGVDINPMAVEMAKLSLWLITLQRDRPFTFLDHALKCGDSLLGVSSVQQIENFSLRPGERQVTFATANLSHYVEEASAKRRALEDLPSNDHTQIETKNRLHAEAEAATAKVKALADCLIAFELRGLNGDSYEDAREAEAAKAQVLMTRDADASLNSQLPSISQLSAYARERMRGRHPFHWAVEFPEVFIGGGFDAVEGNPPYMGGRKITGAFDTAYRNYLVSHLARGWTGHADLCAYFLLRIASLLRQAGNFGLVATSAIAEGVSREVSLDQLEISGYSIYRAASSSTWQGTASVTFAAVWLHKGQWDGRIFLNDSLVTGITPFLNEKSGVSGAPHSLVSNRGISFQGSIVLGDGFIVTPERAAELIRKNPDNQKVLFPYLTSQDFNSSPIQVSSRWVINFFDWPLDRASAPSGYTGPVASDFPECLATVQDTVKQERLEKAEDVAKAPWWQFWRLRANLYRRCNALKFSLAVARAATKYVTFGIVEQRVVFSDAITVFTTDSFEMFGLLNSNLHEVWSRAYASYNLQLLRYAPTDLFETFPFPEHIQPACSDRTSVLGQLSKRFHEDRQNVMLQRDAGFTDIYNLINTASEKSEDIARLRALHEEMDQAVAAAYGWSDLDLGHGFHATKQGERYTLSEPARRTVLDRLLALNHQRHAEEVKAGLHDKKKPRAKPRKVVEADDHPRFDFGTVGARASDGKDSDPAGAIVTALRAASAPLGKARLVAAAGIEEAAWGPAIRQLKESGAVIQEGDKRGATYRLP